MKENRELFHLGTLWIRALIPQIRMTPVMAPVMGLVEKVHERP
jgi:hypothetical protein